MTRWRDRAIVAGIALILGSACSQGAPGNPFPGFPPAGPAGPDTSSTGGDPATFGPADGSGECCLANGSPGCSDSRVEACVCAESMDCCSTEWTGECAALVDALGCAVCDGPLDSGPDPDDSGEPSGQACCGAGSEPGCNDPEVEACVCAEIEYCCDTAWEEVCASAVDALGCGHCGGDETGEPPPPGGSTGEPPPPPVGGCCEPQMGPGCSDMAVEACVCAQDDFCCNDTWDQVCVDEVDEFMCGDCGGVMPPPPPGASPCCEIQPGPGCGDPFVEACVCLIDDYCCNMAWDATCTLLAGLFPCGEC